jgi:hypothetical protein
VSPDPDAVRAAMTTAERLEKEWLGVDPGTDPRFLPWMPFPIPSFISLVAEAFPKAPGNSLLGVGCGIATKEMLAREIFGLRVTGIEASRVYAEQAKALGVHVLVGDAANFPDYGRYALIWFYRPIDDPVLQAALEKTVWDQMAAGAVVICANLEAPPTDWHELLSDWEARRAILMKPPRA